MGGRVRREPRAVGVFEVFLSSLRLGLTSFGGPIAHIGYLRREYVVRRVWLSDDAFASIVALCQFLPGPASSQVNMSIGILRAGPPGALAAWTGFTLPSAAALTAFAYLVAGFDVSTSGWLHGLMLAAAAVVAQAVWAMAPRLAPGPKQASIAVAVAAASLLLPFALVQVLLIVAAGILGRLILHPAGQSSETDISVPIPRWLSVVSLVLLAVLLAGLPLLDALEARGWVTLAASFTRAGALVFGGGHVVLPLLHQAVVTTGAISDAQFLAGYGAAQAVPGPLFTFAAYLGALMPSPPNGIAGAAIALCAIFLPSFLLLFGALPFWSLIRKRSGFASALAGINAAVLGLLAAALYQPVWTGAVHGIPDFCIVLCGFALLVFWKVRPWIVVGLGACAGALLGLLA